MNTGKHVHEVLNEEIEIRDVDAYSEGYSVDGVGSCQTCGEDTIDIYGSSEIGNPSVEDVSWDNSSEYKIIY